MSDPKELFSQTWASLRAFAKATGCPLGADVLDWFIQHRNKRPSEFATMGGVQGGVKPTKP